MTAKPSLDRPLRVGLVALGCAKNLVDAEIMLGTLLQDGVEITSDVSRADVVIINTCSFIDSAQQESVDTILESAAVREAGHRGQGLIVAGCLPQRFREELPKLLPEVDAFMGIDQVTKITEVVKHALAKRAAKLGGTEDGGRRPEERGPRTEDRGRRPEGMGGPTPSALRPAPALVEVNPRPHYMPDYTTARFRLTPRHFAYLKIAEGCNHPCSFCIIPRMRGAHRSRPQTDLVAEARALLGDEVKELNLISQDSTYYGLDLRPQHRRAIASPGKFGAAVKALPPAATTICTLLRQLNDLPGDFWIRLLYTHPAHWTDELIQTVAQCPKIARE